MFVWLSSLSLEVTCNEFSGGIRDVNVYERVNEFFNEIILYIHMILIEVCCGVVVYAVYVMVSQ